MLGAESADLLYVRLIRSSDKMGVGLPGTAQYRGWGSSTEGVFCCDIILQEILDIPQLLAMAVGKKKSAQVRSCLVHETAQVTCHTKNSVLSYIHSFCRRKNIVI